MECEYNIRIHCATATPYNLWLESSVQIFGYDASTLASNSPSLFVQAITTLRLHTCLPGTLHLCSRYQVLPSDNTQAFALSVKTFSSTSKSPKLSNPPPSSQHSKIKYRPRCVKKSTTSNAEHSRSWSSIQAAVSSTIEDQQHRNSRSAHSIIAR